MLSLLRRISPFGGGWGEVLNQQVNLTLDWHYMRTLIFGELQL